MWSCIWQLFIKEFYDDDDDDEKMYAGLKLKYTVRKYSPKQELWIENDVFREMSMWVWLWRTIRTTRECSA